MKIETIKWEKGKIKLVDQTRLPLEFKYIYIDNIEDLWQAIKVMKVRGAPALGAAAALGVYLGIKDCKVSQVTKLKDEVDKVSKYIGSSRPTARNLFWALERIKCVVSANQDRPVSVIKNLIFQEAEKIVEEDKTACRRIGSYGSRLINKNDTILTVCNAGALATIDYGTALGVIYRAKEEKKNIKVFACETRPMLQGARLTAWELQRKEVDVTLICDNMAATLMRQGKINKVIAGADRIALNGDTANKIGTYSLAVLSHYHKIPFYIAAPVSTFDLTIKTGSGIPIELRSRQEMVELFFKQPITAKGVKVYHPAFDVTPHNLIKAIITDRGVIKPPYIRNIQRMLVC